MVEFDVTSLNNARLISVEAVDILKEFKKIVNPLPSKLLKNSVEIGV